MEIQFKNEIPDTHFVPIWLPFLCFIKLTPNISHSQAAATAASTSPAMIHRTRRGKRASPRRPRNGSVRPSKSTWTIRYGAWSSRRPNPSWWPIRSAPGTRPGTFLPLSFSESRGPAHSSEKHERNVTFWASLSHEKEIALPGSLAEVVLIKLNVSLHCQPWGRWLQVTVHSQYVYMDNNIPILTQLRQYFH